MKNIRNALMVLLVAILAIGGVACNIFSKYFDEVASYSFWDNEAHQSIPQYRQYEIMDDFLSEGTITDGRCIGSDGKVRKVLFLGWDGARAGAMLNIFFNENNPSDNGVNHEAAEYSGLHALKKTGGLYLAYAGGEKGKDSQQDTSTSPGWTTALTGGWNTLHGIKTNNDSKTDGETIMFKYAKLGLDTSLVFDWDQYFDVNLKDEVSYLLENPSVPMSMRDIDRIRTDDYSKLDTRAASPEHYNLVAGDHLPDNAHYDIAVKEYIAGRIEAGDDIIVGIFESADANGHDAGFSNKNPGYVNGVRNSDLYLYSLLQIIDEREKGMDEDWLVLIAADHGGIGKGHGRQTCEERTIWVACNKPIDEKYFGMNYDGTREND